MSPWLRAAASLLLTVFLAACGGGGGDSTPPKPNTAPTVTVGAAQTVLLGTAVQVTGTGMDADGDAITYAWTVSSKPDGSAVTSASLTAAATDKAGFVPDVAGNYALSLVVSDGKASSAPALVTVTAQGADKLAISISAAEPLSGAVTLSLTGPATGPQVSWYADLKAIGNGASVTWDSSTATNGQVQLLARVPLAGGGSVDVKRNVMVSNANITLRTLNVLDGPFSGPFDIYIRADSPNGIASVTGRVDATVIGTLTAPNACFDGGGCTGANNAYRFRIDTNALGSGAHTVTFVAVDGQGFGKQVVLNLQFDNVPVLTLTEPLDGSFVYDTLKISGQATSDKPGAVKVDVKLGDLPIIQATGPTFSSNYDVSGLTPGTYKVTVTATDSAGKPTTAERQIVKSSSAALVYSPILSIGAGGRLLAADGDRVLYKTSDRAVHLRDTAAGTDVALQGVPDDPTNSAKWWFVDGRAYTTITVSAACPKGCVYQWDTDAAVKELNAGNPWAMVAGYPYNLVVRSGYVLWANGTSSFTLYNVAAGTYRQVKPDPATSINPSGFDMTMVGGVPNVFYSGNSGDAAKGFDTYRWSANTGTAVDLSSGGQNDLELASDGVRVAWIQAPLGNASSRQTLVAAPVAGGSITTMSTKLTDLPTLKDGVLAWREASQGGDADTLKVATASATSTLKAGVPGTYLWANEAGYVFYETAGKLYYWSAQQGTSTLLADTSAYGAVSSGKTFYFLSGPSNLLFKVKAN
ncbi:Ig-like domain-containing protein [Roseateles sp. NT4]|uniref:Ig-like domain-containing protein n=1 Tax=Roseateles sp. NT4 TaxID=3453715 RepID=UPI003EEEB4AE